MRSGLSIYRLWGRWRWVMLAVGLGGTAGCGKPDAAVSPAAPAATNATVASAVTNPVQTGGRVVFSCHWLGKNQLAQDPNAAYQMAIWQLPESVNLERQTLDKLARALPGFLGSSDGDAKTEQIRLLRGLLNDVLQAESFVELKDGFERELFLAVRLTPERSALWASNIALITASNNAPEPILRLLRQKDWTVLGIGNRAALELGEFADRIKNQSLQATNASWLQLKADLAALIPYGFTNLPTVELEITGAGRSVRTRGELTFPQAVGTSIHDWNVPTNLVNDPVISFTAMRGLSTLFGKWGGLLQVNSAPDQLYFWTLEAPTFLAYAAVLWPDSSEALQSINTNLFIRMEPFLATNAFGGQLNLTNGGERLDWGGLPFFQPFLRLETGGGKEYIVGGLFPLMPTRRPLPPELLSQFMGESNLMYYHWEMTGLQMPGWLQLLQASRMIAGRPQLEGKSAGMKWLFALSDKLGNTSTSVKQLSPIKLGFSRSSSLGFSALELHLLIDWLESPTFPRGLHTFEAPKPDRGILRGN